MRPISRSEKQKTLAELSLRGFPVPEAGIEPARIAPLVFETSASTDSAIRAGVHIRSLMFQGVKEARSGLLLFLLRIAKVFDFSENAKYKLR